MCTHVISEFVCMLSQRVIWKIEDLDMMILYMTMLTFYLSRNMMRFR